MNAGCKTILSLAAVALLLCIPMADAAETDDVQAPPAINLAAGRATIFPSARGMALPRVLCHGTIALAPCPVSFHQFAEHVADFVFGDCRSNLRSLCLLRC